MKIYRISYGSTASGILDLMRFCAALTVFILHGTANHLVPGYQAVMVFFVLSGYFVGAPALASVSRGTWRWKEYLINRLTRLWLVLIPALFLTWMWATIQGHLFGKDTLRYFQLRAWTFVGNMFFLQGHHIAVYGGNGPLWSLSFEFWYYILFPCIALALWSPTAKRKVAYSMVALVVGAFMYFVIGNRILEYFLIWLLGVVLSLFQPIHLSATRKYLLYIAAWMIALASLWIPYYILHVHLGSPETNPFGPDFVVGVCFMALVYVVVSSFNTPVFRPSRFTSIATYLAGFSYTLYLVHDPLLNLRGPWKEAIPNSILNTGSHLEVRGLTFVSIILYAWLISIFTERRTGQVRRLVITTFNRTRSFNESLHSFGK